MAFNYNIIAPYCCLSSHWLMQHSQWSKENGICENRIAIASDFLTNITISGPIQA